MSAVFLDTSVVLRLVFEEPGADEVQARLGRARQLLASRLLRIEAERAVHRLVKRLPSAERSRPALDHALRALWPRVDFWDMTEEVCALAGRIEPESHLRSLDAIHLATWQLARTEIPELEFLTVDNRLRALV